MLRDKGKLAGVCPLKSRITMVCGNYAGAEARTYSSITREGYHPPPTRTDEGRSLIMRESLRVPGWYPVRTWRHVRDSKPSERERGASRSRRGERPRCKAVAKRSGSYGWCRAIRHRRDERNPATKAPTGIGPSEARIGRRAGAITPVLASDSLERVATAVRGDMPWRARPLCRHVRTVQRVHAYACTAMHGGL